MVETQFAKVARHEEETTDVMPIEAWAMLADEVQHLEVRERGTERREKKKKMTKKI